MTVQESPTRPRRETGTTCPTCGADAERGQLICLECGSRITLSYRKPPGWHVPVLIIGVVLLLAGAGTFLGLRAVSDDAEDEVASKPARVDRVAAGSDEDADKNASNDGDERAGSGDSKKAEPEKKAERKPKAGAEKKAKEEAKEAAPAPSRGGIATWPRDRVGYTVVVLSAEDRVTARKFAASANKSGAKLGVIRTDSFGSLPQGFYVVFSGYYETRGPAERAANRLGRRFSGAFPQLVKR